MLQFQYFAVGLPGSMPEVLVGLFQNPNVKSVAAAANCVSMSILPTSHPYVFIVMNMPVTKIVFAKNNPAAHAPGPKPRNISPVSRI